MAISWLDDISGRSAGSLVVTHSIKNKGKFYNHTNIILTFWTGRQRDRHTERITHHLLKPLGLGLKVQKVLETKIT